MWLHQQFRLNSRYFPFLSPLPWSGVKPLPLFDKPLPFIYVSPPVQGYVETGEKVHQITTQAPTFTVAWHPKKLLGSERGAKALVERLVSYFRTYSGASAL